MRSVRNTAAALFLLSAGTVFGLPVRFSTEIAGEAAPAEPVEGTLHLSPQSADASKHQPIEVSWKSPGEGALELPAGSAWEASGSFDLRFRSDAFAPVYLWGVKVAAGKRTDLGEIPLRRGASVSGWIEMADGAPPPPECRVELAPETARDPDDPTARDRIRSLTLEARANERGFFQFFGVTPGRYELKATQAGYAPVRMSPIEVRLDLESTVIDRLVLHRPVSFEVVLDPPVEPYGKAWEIWLSRRKGPSEPPLDFVKGEASREGVWKSPGLAPGTYELVILGDLKSMWHTEQVEAGPGSRRYKSRCRSSGSRARSLWEKNHFRRPSG